MVLFLVVARLYKQKLNEYKITINQFSLLISQQLKGWIVKKFPGFFIVFKDFKKKKNFLAPF